MHEERRFFVKNAQIAPSGHPIFYAYGGLLANTRRNHPVSLSRTFYYQAGAALRLANDLALDASILGTQHKAILEAGGWLIEGRTQLRAAGLVSSAGDSGALLEVASGGHGPLSASLDVRRIWSSNGRALIPLPAHVDSFGLMPPTGVQLANGSYTQATGSLSLSLGRGYLSLVGSFRKDRHLKADYSIGPSVNWPLVTRNRVQLAFEASAQRTRSSTAAFAGLKMLFSAKRVSMIGTAGQGYEEDRGDGGRKIARSVGSLSAQYSYEIGSGHRSTPRLASTGTRPPRPFTPAAPSTAGLAIFVPTSSTISREGEGPNIISPMSWRWPLTRAPRLLEAAIWSRARSSSR